jgi:hypothetical protein
MARKLVTAILILTLAGAWLPAMAKSAKPLNSLARRAFFGMGTAELPDSMRVRIAPDTTGWLLLAVVKGRTAEKMGMQKNDVLLKLNDVPVNDRIGVRDIVLNYKTGVKVKAEYWHEGQRKTASAALTEYPRESAPDFDILYDAFRDGDSLRRVIITRPRAAGKYPVVVYLPGPGAFDIDRNRDIYQYPLQELLYELTRAGFVTVRMDKPGQGDSQGPATATLTFDDEVNFLTNGLNALTKWDFIDPQRVLLFAHGLGGIHAPLVAAHYPVQGIMAVNSIGTGWLNYEVNRFRRESVLEGLPYDSVEALAARKDRALHLLCMNKETPEQIERENPALASSLPDGLLPAYWQSMADLNVPALWRSVTVPVLVLGGTADYVTTADESRTLADVLNSFHPGQATYVELKDLDHDLKTMPSWQASYDSYHHTVWFGPTHGEVIPTVVAWAKKTAGI